MTGSEASPSFRLAYVPGVTPAKWVRIWNERLPDVPLALVPVSAAEAADLLRAGGADAGFVRLPVDRTDLSAIPLYTETTVVVVPKDHVVAAVDEVSAEDLADEIVLHPLDDTLDWERPAGAARDRAPRHHGGRHRAGGGGGRGAGRPAVAGPPAPPQGPHLPAGHRTPRSPGSRCPGREDATTDLVEDFIGIVRGRTVNSSRGRPPPRRSRSGSRPALPAAVAPPESPYARAPGPARAAAPRTPGAANPAAVPEAPRREGSGPSNTRVRTFRPARRNWPPPPPTPQVARIPLLRGGPTAGKRPRQMTEYTGNRGARPHPLLYRATP